MPVGEGLKNLRRKLQISVRQVEVASRRIAEAKNDRRFFISNGWLTQIETRDSEPNICKLVSLSAIYGVPLSDLMKNYGVDINESERLHSLVRPHRTQLSATHFDMANEQIKRNARIELSNSTTVLVAATTELRKQLLLSTDQRFTCGYIGLDDFTMYPMIRPGALVRIDTRQRKIQTAWPNEYNRPIYFIELRNSYACGWCELQGSSLLIIPHHSSKCSVRTFVYMREAEIVGRVTGFDTNCLDGS